MKSELIRHGAQLHVEGKGEGTFHDTQVVGHLGSRTINFVRTDFVLLFTIEQDMTAINCSQYVCWMTCGANACTGNHRSDD